MESWHVALHYYPHNTLGSLLELSPKIHAFKGLICFQTPSAFTGPTRREGGFLHKITQVPHVHQQHRQPNKSSYQWGSPETTAYSMLDDATPVRLNHESSTPTIFDITNYNAIDDKVTAQSVHFSSRGVCFGSASIYEFNQAGFTTKDSKPPFWINGPFPHVAHVIQIKINDNEQVKNDERADTVLIIPDWVA